MPIYEFKCPECGKEFERLVMSADDGDVQCPQCGALKCAKVFSVFATGCATKGNSLGTSSSCAPRTGSS